MLLRFQPVNPQHRLQLSKHLFRRFLSLKSIFDERVQNIPRSGTPTGLFGLEELKNPHGFDTYCQSTINAIEPVVQKIRSTDMKPREIVKALDSISEKLCLVADMAQVITSLHPDKKYAEAAYRAYSMISNYMEMLNTDEVLNTKSKNLLLNHKSSLNEEEQVVVKALVNDFMTPKDGKKDEYVNLKGKILEKCSEFSTMSDFDISSQVFKTMKTTNNLEFVVHSMLASEDQSERKKGFKLKEEGLNLNKAKLLREILTSRFYLSNLVNRESYSHMVLEDLLIKTPENADKLLTNIGNSLIPKVEQELKLLRKENNNEPLEAWDIWYLQKACRIRTHGSVLDSVRRGFSLGNVMNGIENLMSKLFGVTFEILPVAPGETWHDSVVKVAIKEEDGTYAGIIYFDLIHRAHKFSHDSHFTVKSSKKILGNEYQFPVVVLNCNFSPVLKGTCLLNIVEVINLFHEMGHAMHSVFSRTEYQGSSGTRCQTDFVETPSILMEYFAKDPRVLSTFAHDYVTGTPISSSYLDSLSDSLKMFSGIEMLKQVKLAALDQSFHSQLSDDFDVFNTIKKMNQRFDLCETGLSWGTSFGHVTSYGSVYYSYLHCQSIASYLWKNLFQEDPFSRKSGEIYRSEILRYGGTKDPREMILKATGRLHDFSYLEQEIKDSYSTT